MAAIPSIHDSAFEETDADRAGTNIYMEDTDVLMVDTDNSLAASAAESITDEDNDSAFYSEGTAGTATISLTGSCTSYIHENGRTYHSYQAGKYPIPNDAPEQQRLDLFHHIFLLFLDDALFIAPLTAPRRVLDLGTGTGCWAVEFAERYPEAEVIGNDLSPIQPAWVWPNLRFEVDDVELEWAYPDGHFDFIHVRCMSACVDDWGRLLREAYRCLAPGGWIEYQDYAGTMNCDHGRTPENSALLRWFQLYQEASRASGRDACVAADMKGWIEEAGFEGVVERVEKWPVGNPGEGAGNREREIGRWTVPALAESLEAFALGFLTRVLEWRKEDVEELVRHARAELKERERRYYARVYFVCGRKPE